jgi:hypothetical protein
MTNVKTYELSHGNKVEFIKYLRDTAEKYFIDVNVSSSEYHIDNADKLVDCYDRLFAIAELVAIKTSTIIIEDTLHELAMCNTIILTELAIKLKKRG